jgi:hypothetical protein
MTAGEIRFGFPEFSAQVFEKFSRFFEVTGRASDALDGILTNSYSDVEPLEKVILNLGILAGNAVMELVTLVGNGCGLGAMKIHRTLLETVINAEYLRLVPSDCDDYLDWIWVEQYKLLEYVRKHMADRLKDVSNISEIEAEFNKVRSRFERPNGRLRGSWCRLDLGSRAAKAGFQEPYALIHPMASGLIHGTISGLAMHREGGGDDIRIGTPPSLQFCEQALVGAHSCLLRIIDTLSNSLNTKSTPSLAELVKDYEYAWGKVDLTARP